MNQAAYWDAKVDTPAKLEMLLQLVCSLANGVGTQSTAQVFYAWSHTE